MMERKTFRNVADAFNYYGVTKKRERPAQQDLDKLLGETRALVASRLAASLPHASGSKDDSEKKP